VVGTVVLGFLLLVLITYGLYELLLQNDDAFLAQDQVGGELIPNFEDEIAREATANGVNVIEINDSIHAGLEAHIKDHVMRASQEGLQREASRVVGKSKYEEKILNSVYEAMQVR
jgi:hypothetical protein